MYEIELIASLLNVLSESVEDSRLSICLNYCVTLLSGNDLLNGCIDAQCVLNVLNGHSGFTEDETMVINMTQGLLRDVTT